MNFPQFLVSTVLAAAFALLVIWGAIVSSGNSKLAATQVELQGKIEKARVQQRVLEQIIQRTAVLGQNDAAIVALLGKYGLAFKQQDSSAPTPDAAATPRK